ncbi:MAG: hypothetical protein ACREX3_05845 [Gammaproteobacteria bacterium]
MGRIGRPTKLNKAVAAKILKELERGAPIEAAGPLAGIGRRTFYDWMYRGARALAAEEAGKEVPEEEKPFMEFYTAVEEARSEWETRQLEGIEEAGKSGPQYWTARAWLLERRMPEKYALKARVEHKHELRIEVGHGPEQIEGEVLDEGSTSGVLSSGNGDAPAGPARGGEVFGPLVREPRQEG